MDTDTCKCGKLKKASHALCATCRKRKSRKTNPERTNSNKKAYRNRHIEEIRETDKARKSEDRARKSEDNAANSSIPRSIYLSRAERIMNIANDIPLPGPLTHEEAITRLRAQLMPRATECAGLPRRHRGKGYKLSLPNK
jgi:uncharacterized Zn finger protein (UPF0148 family)